MKSQIKIIGSLLVSALLISTYQNCSQIDSLQSSNGKSLVSYKNVVSSSPHVVVSESESQAASHAPVSPIGNPTDLNPGPKVIVSSSNLQAQSNIQRQRDISAGYLDGGGNPVPPAPPSTGAPTCTCDQYIIGTGEISLIATEDVDPAVIPQILNISTQYVCSVAIPRPVQGNPGATNVEDVITGALTYFKCSGTGYANTVFNPDVPHFSYRAPNGCVDSGRAVQTNNSMSCRHQADTQEPYGELNNQEWLAFANNFGLNTSNGLPDNNPIPSPTCQDHYNLYYALALGTGENPTYFPNVSFECRRIYFAAANGGDGCYDDLINLSAQANGENCPAPEHFNCQTSASGCSN